MTVLLDALLALVLFNLLFLFLAVAGSALPDDRRKRGPWRDALRRLAPFRAPEQRVLPWEPFISALEDRRAPLSERDARPHD
jgi:hypothetical protein